MYREVMELAQSHATGGRRTLNPGNLPLERLLSLGCIDKNSLQSGLLCSCLEMGIIVHSP